MHTLIDKLRENEVRLDTQNCPLPIEGAHANANGKTSVLIFSPLKHEMSLLALGALSIYHELNASAKESAWADRAFFYDFLFDDAGHVKDSYSKEPLISFEQKIPIKDFDLVAYGMTYPGGIKDFSKFMKLAHIPLLRCDRGSGKYPIIVGGGPGFANPEPYGDLIDAFVVGSRAEGPICELTRTLTKFKGRSRTDILRELSRIDGVYVPDAYSHKYEENGRLVSICEIEANDSNSNPIHPQSLQEQPHHFSSRIVGYKTGVVVVNRGCKFECAFCQLGAQELQNQPYEKVTKVVDELFAAGITTMIINSPTFTQFEGRNELLDHIAKRAAERGAGDFKLYVGSVRIDEIDEEYLQRLSSFGNFNHTYLKYTNDPHNSFIAVAPEFGTDRLMRLMRKGLTRSKVLEGVRRASNSGIKNIHCYFLVGIESETAEDRFAIASLVREMMDVAGNDSRFYLKTNLYIPTVGTIGQRMPMESVREYDSALQDIKAGIDTLFSPDERGRIEIIRLEEERLLLEALLMRGGRNVRPILSQLLSNNGEMAMTEDQLKKMCESVNVRYTDLLSGFSIDDVLPWDRVRGVAVEKDRERQFLSSIRKKSHPLTILQ